MEVWALAGELIAERPLLGYGFSNSGVIPARPGTFPLTGQPRVIPMYPHNVLLQAQLELGAPGLLFFYGGLGYLLWRLMTYPRTARAAGLALIAAAMSVWCVGYPLWRSTWLAWLIFTAIALNASTALQAARACRES
jgi:O-antigen ligase